MALDEAQRAAIEALLAEAPPLNTEQAALVVRAFTGTTQIADTDVSDTAA